MKIIAVIPCLNEEKFIGGIVSKTLKYVDKVIVVDDGSTDNTSVVAQKNGAIVIRHKSSRGYGAAIKTGFEEANKMNADVVITLDGDGQHNPDEIPLLIQAVTRGKADMVIGSRFIDPNARIRLHRRLGISTITFLYNFGMKVRSSDSQSGFRAYTRKFLSSIHLEEDGMGLSVETLIKARKMGLKKLEVQITCFYHRYPSLFNAVIHGIKVCFAVIKWRWKTELLQQKI